MARSLVWKDFPRQRHVTSTITHLASTLRCLEHGTRVSLDFEEGAVAGVLFCSGTMLLRVLGGHLPFTLLGSLCGCFVHSCMKH